MKLVFDIDATILESVVKENGDYTLIGVNQKVIDKLNRSYDRGNEIILETGRHWNHLQITQEQLAEAKVKYHTLIMGKPIADLYVDDKAATPDEFLEREISI